jgi:energy-coupling factor transporter ATP-binding protein EcfA2
MIDVEALTFRYRGAEIPSLTDITLSIPRGQFVTVIGANGAGKSTLCYALSGMIPHHFPGEYQGRVRIDGRELASQDLGASVGLVGLVFQNPFNQITGARYTVREEVAFGLENLGIAKEEMDDRIQVALKQAGLAAEADRSPFALSGGQQQRLAIASILAMQPDVLILDEPTSQLDPIGTRGVFEVLDRLSETMQSTIILVEHKIELGARYADRVIHLHKGRLIADGSPRQVLADPRLSELGVQPTRYTTVARAALERGRVNEKVEIPVTLSQAVEVFGEN